MPLIYAVREDSRASLGLQGDPKGNQFWIFIGRTDAETETPILWPPDGKSRLIWKDPVLKDKAGREDGDRGWDGWMASLTQWTCVWASFRKWWWTGKPCVLQSMGYQRVKDNWVTELTKFISHPSLFPLLTIRLFSMSESVSALHLYSFVIFFRFNM